MTTGPAPDPVPAAVPSPAPPAVTGAVPVAVLGAVSLGGALGALARYGVWAALPAPDRGIPWGTLLANVSGSLLLGALVVVLTETARDPHPLLRPFLGVGLLGGYTTFSAYSVETVALLEAGATGTALLYLLGTLGLAVAAVHVGAAAARAVTARTVTR